MSAEKLKLEVLLAAIDKATGPLKHVMGASKQTAAALKAAKDNLKQLNDAQNRVDGFRKTAKEAAITINQLKAARSRLREVKKAMAETVTPSKALTRALKDAQQNVSTHSLRLHNLTDKYKRLKGELADNGVNIKQLKAYQTELGGQIDLATAAVDRETAAMQRQNMIANKLYAAKANYTKTMAWSSKARNAGMMAGAAGAAIGLPVAKALKDYATFEDAMLGVAKQVAGARDENGKLTATYYEMGQAIKAMSERIPMATTDIAAIVEAGAKMGIQGKQNLLIYAETTAVMAEAFELPVEQIGEQIGKISRLYKIPIQDVKALGDAINWLDDNAESSGGDIIEVMQRVAGSATMAGMNFKEAAALGSTFLTLGAKAEVAASATNAMIRELSVATMQSKRFKAGLDMIKLDANAVQLGMGKDATGTIIKVLEAIKQLPQEKQLEAATRLFGKEFGDDAAKLAQNLDEYRRQLELVNAESAKGSMDREADARKESINARMKMAKSAMFNLSSDLGEHLKPALVETLEKTLSIVTAIRAWAAENPGFASGLMTAVKWLSIGVTAIGALLLVVSAVLIPLAAMNFGLGLLGTTLGGVAIFFKALALKAIPILGAALRGLFLLVRAHPFALLLSIGAYVIGFLVTKWGDLKAMFKAGDWIGIGKTIIQGIEAGLDALTLGLYSKVMNIFSGLGTVAKKALGIKSPSRVFAAIGGYTMEGLEQGILRGQDGPLAALAKAAKGITAAGAGMLVSGAAMAMPALDTRPPLGMGGGMMGGGAPMIVQITINPSPGMDEQALARHVAAELEKIEARRAARGRSRLADRD